MIPIIALLPLIDGAVTLGIQLIAAARSSGELDADTEKRLADLSSRLTETSKAVADYKPREVSGR